MGFANNKFAKVWEVTRKPKFTEVKISTSKKVNNQYETDFSAIVRFIGTAHEKAASMQEGEKIKLLSVEATNKYDNTRHQLYSNYICWDFEIADGKPIQNNTENDTPTDMMIEEDELPF